MELAKYKIYIAIGITILSLTLLTVLFVVPTIQDIYSLAQQVKSQKVELATFELQENNIKDLKKNQAEVEEKLDIVESALISPDNTLALILPFEKIAAQNNITQNITIHNSPSDDKEERGKDKGGEYSLNNIPYLPVNLSLRGDFKNILAYIAAMEHVGVYIDTTTINITASSSGNNTPADEEEEKPADKLIATMEIRAFTTE